MASPPSPIDEPTQAAVAREIISMYLLSATPFGGGGDLTPVAERLLRMDEAELRDLAISLTGWVTMSLAMAARRTEVPVQELWQIMAQQEALYDAERT